MYKYTYFTKEEIEANLSRMKTYGKVIVEMHKGSDEIVVRYGVNGEPKSVKVDRVARKMTSNDSVCAVVDCDEGMMVFPSEADREEFVARM